MSEGQTELDRRVQTIVARRNDLLPLFPIERRITQVDAFGILTQEQAARVDVVRETEQIFTQYAVSLHAHLGDLLSHPEELIYRDRRYLTFAQTSDDPGYLHYVGLERQRSKVDNQEAITCKSAVHFLAPSTALSEVSGHPLTCAIGQGALTPYFARIWLPKHYRDVSVFEFDDSGRFLGLYNEESDNLVRYSLSDDNFFVHMLYKRDTSVDGEVSWDVIKEYDYIYREGEGFFRLAVTPALPARTTNIQHEVATALAKLPMNPIDETPKNDAVRPDTDPQALISLPTPRSAVRKVFDYLKSVSRR